MKTISEELQAQRSILSKRNKRNGALAYRWQIALACAWERLAAWGVGREWIETVGILMFAVLIFGGVFALAFSGTI